jgi:hypothetical protein
MLRPIERAVPPHKGAPYLFFVFLISNKKKITKNAPALARKRFQRLEVGVWLASRTPLGFPYLLLPSLIFSSIREGKGR